MGVSVIISNLNGARFLPRLLETLQAQQEVQLQIIVVDRESKDESQKILRGHPGLKVVSEPPLTGLVSGYARGAREAVHEHLFFCNEDMWFDPHCLSRLEKQIDLSRRIAAADPWQWTYDGAEWIHGATRFKKARWAINGVHPFRSIDFNIATDDGASIPFACAGAFLIHREVYKAIGEWDTTFFLDNEDIELFVRFWQQNWKCVTVPSAKVFHAVGMSNTQEPGQTIVPTAGRRRYISNRLGKSIIIWKYFSTRCLWMSPAVYLVMFTNNFLRCRGKIVSWDLAVLVEFLRRAKDLQAFRRRNKILNRQKPGELFFTEQNWQV